MSLGYDFDIVEMARKVTEQASQSRLVNDLVDKLMFKDRVPIDEGLDAKHKSIFIEQNWIPEQGTYDFTSYLAPSRDDKMRAELVMVMDEVLNE